MKLVGDQQTPSM